MKYTIFGESHGPAIGAVITGVPAGTALDMNFILSQMSRRAPGKNALGTSRSEADKPEFLSGVLFGEDGGVTATGAPLCITIQNGNTRSRDYDKLRNLPRPSHSDYAAGVRYGGHSDMRGGGHFSGRLTAPLVFAGALAEQLLAGRGAAIAANISRIGQVVDTAADYVKPDMAALRELRSRILPTLSPSAAKAMEAEILAAKEAGDSVGGAVTCYLTGVPAGLGEPDLGGNVEGIFARHLFAIPAVRAVEFGDGVAVASMRGSESNDAFYMENGMVKTKTNHSGGVNGGITNGMPLVFTVYFRPTPSIARAQETVNLKVGADETLTIEGRHDPCIVQRAVPVVEAAAALALLDLWGM